MILKKNLMIDLKITIAFKLMNQMQMTQFNK